MADNYWGKCAMCENFDLRDKWLGKYYCSQFKMYFTVFEDQCKVYFRPAGPERGYSRTELVEMARNGKL